MTEQPTVAVETPKRKLRVHLPSRSTVAKAGALTGAFLAGAWVAKRKLAGNCPLESDTTEQPSTTDN